MDLSHIKMITDIYEDYGPVSYGPYVLLYNAQRISREEALYHLRSSKYSPYVLRIPQAQMDGLFRNLPPESKENEGSLTHEC